MPTKLVRTTIALLALCLATTSCGASERQPSAAGAETTATSVGDAPTAPYASKGPYDVGYTDLELDDGRRVLVWYPADPERADIPGTEQRFDPYGGLRPDLLARIPSADRVTYPIDADHLASPAAIDGGAPLVLYAHPCAAAPEFSATIMTHIASWGFVVAAPEQVERSTAGLYGNAADSVAPRTDDQVLGATIDLLETESAGDGLLAGTVDPDHVAVTGASQGANVAYGFASTDPRVDGFISYAAGFGGQAEPTPATPDVPGMLMLADQDQAVPMFSKKLYARMDEPKYLVKVYDAGHEVFTDVCRMGGDDHWTVDVLEEQQIIPRALTDLAKDGCQPELPPVEEAWPAIDQASVSFLRWVTGIDEEPVGLTTSAVSQLGTPVTVTEGD